MLTLADLEDYVPQEGETFGCGGPVPSASDDPPCEVAVLQREIDPLFPRSPSGPRPLPTCICNQPRDLTQGGLVTTLPLPLPLQRWELRQPSLMVDPWALPDPEPLARPPEAPVVPELPALLAPGVRA